MAEKFTHIDTANVANIIAHALAIYSDFEALHQAISADGSKVPDFWEAPVAKKYGTGFEKLDQNLTNFLANQKDFIDNLKSVSKEYDIEEEEMLELINAIDINLPSQP